MELQLTDFASVLGIAIVVVGFLGVAVLAVLYITKNAEMWQLLVILALMVIVEIVLLAFIIKKQRSVEEHFILKSTCVHLETKTPGSLYLTPSTIIFTILDEKGKEKSIVEINIKDITYVESGFDEGGLEHIKIYSGDKVNSFVVEDSARWVKEIKGMKSYL